MNNSLVSTNTQKVLDYLIQYPGRQFLANEIQKSTKVSRAGINFSLRELARERLVFREKKGKIYLYSVDPNNPIIKQLKVLNTIVLLHSLVTRVKKNSEKITLFGSCARGENIYNSDIDIFVLTNDRDAVEKELRKHNIGKKLQVIIRTPLKFTEMEKKEPVFFEEISRGVTLWEEKR